MRRCTSQPLPLGNDDARGCLTRAKHHALSVPHEDIYILGLNTWAHLYSKQTSRYSDISPVLDMRSVANPTSAPRQTRNCMYDDGCTDV